MFKSLIRLAIVACLCSAGSTAQEFKLDLVTSVTTGFFDQGGSEIVSYDPGSRRIYSVNAGNKSIDVIDAAQPAFAGRIMRLAIPAGFGSSPNSVSVRNGIVAVAVEANPKTNPGYVVFMDLDGNLIKGVQVGAQPDMLTFTPDGTKVLTANEGEPNDAYTIDPEGSVSIIDISDGVRNVTQEKVTTLTFKQYDEITLNSAIRVYGPRALASTNLEPEYIAVSNDSSTAYVSLQEANAIAVIDLATNRFVRLMPLGFKDHSKAGNGFDASDRDNKIDIRTWPVLGMYQPDAIAYYEVGGKGYLVTANEGDTRGWTGYNEEARVATLNLDPTAFPNGTELKRNENLGRLTVSRASGDTDGDGDFDRLYVFGGRSFSIFSTDGELVFDSGDAFERILAQRFPQNFNSDAGGGLDTRSDNKGPEPEGLVVAQLGGKWYAFIGLERMSGVMVYDISDPAKPTFVNYTTNWKFEGNPQAGTAGDIGPEGIAIVTAANSPTDQPLLLVANEISGSTAIYQITLPVPPLEARITPAEVTTVSPEVQLDASGTMGQPVSFNWRVVGRSASIISRDPMNRRVSIQFGQGFGEYVIELTVTDAAGNTSTATAKLFNAALN